MPVTGGELLARSLAAAGVTEVFTLHGGHLDAFLVACGPNGLRLTDCRHESSAGHAADAYARVTGRPGVCVTTSGPGFTNTYTAIANAFLDSTPTLFVIGGPPLRESETNPLQGGFDQVAAARPVTKWAHQVTHPERIPELVALALRHAESGRPGPVLLEIPIDVMFYPVDDSRVRLPASDTPIPRPAPAADQIDAALDTLARAERPVILTGGGAVYSGCAADLREFAERLSVPVFSPNKGEGLLPGTHPLYCGGAAAVGMLPQVAEAPDLVILLGARMGLYLGGRHAPLAGTTIIQIDTDPTEIGRLHDVAVPIPADCRATLAALNVAARQRPLPTFEEWATRAVQARDAHQHLYPDPATITGRLHPYYAAREIVAALPSHTISVLDGGETAAWAGFFLAPDRPASVLRHGTLGCLGIGQGFAIGAGRAAPDRPVLLLTGDGAVGFHIAEFETMVRHGLPVVTVVFNNQVWAMSIHGQRALYGDQGVVVSELPDSAYEQVAIAFGGYGRRIDKLDELGPAVAEAFAAGRPVCLNVAIDPEVVHPLTAAMVAGGAGTDEVLVPYYENVPLR